MIGSEKIFDSGSCWLRADLHLHTIADEDFIFENKHNKSFQDDFINTLKEKNIRLGAISNNNKFDTEEFVTLWQSAWNEGIYLLPAIELTIKEGLKGAHIIVIFEERWLDNPDEINYISAFLDSLPENLDNPAVLRQKGLDLEATVEQLDSYGYDYFIILAHIDLKNGLCAELDGIRLKKFIEQNAFEKRVLGIEKTKNEEKITKLEKLLEDKLPVVICEKCAHEKSIKSIGMGKPLYLKVGDWGYYAIKNALQNHETQLSDSLHQHKTQYIKSIHFESSTISGKEINFNSEMNCITGRKGSGKSAIIESIRYALDKKSFGNVEYKNNLPTLIAGDEEKISIEIANNHNTIRIERTGNGKVLYFIDNNPIENIDEYLNTDRIIYFGQGELSNIKADFGEEFFLSLIADALKDVYEKIDKRNKDVRQLAHNIFANGKQDNKQNLSEFDEDEINVLLNSIAKMQILWQDEFEVIKNETRRINSFSLPIRTQVVAQDNREAYYNFMKSIFGNDTMVDEKLKEIVSAYRNPVLIFEDILHNSGEIFQLLDSDHLQLFKTKFYKNVGDLITYRPLDIVKIRYNRRLFNEISQGEKASAVLLLLLMFDSIDIVIIDCPEQAIDNHTIYNELIPQIIAAKNKTQFIFATQNPNIVVPSSCEQIIISSKTEDTISFETGSLDNVKVQELLLDIMEGGTKAFKHRSEIYSSWRC